MNLSQAPAAPVNVANVKTIFRREFENYFNTPIGYVFLATFSIFTNFFFFYLPGFWEINMATMDNFFSWVRIVFIFFVPAITMRLWAEEKRSGTIEILFTLPHTPAEAILGKFFSALCFLTIALLSTLFIPVSIGIVGDPDWMVIIGGYFGIIFLGGAYIALGLYISWLTQDQIIAFLISTGACFFFFLLGLPQLLQLLGPVGPAAAYLSVSWHFDSISRGLFDTRNFLYFLTFIYLFLYLNYRGIEQSR